MCIDRRDITLYCSVVACIAITLFFGIDLMHLTIDLPLVCWGDELHYLSIARSMLDGGSWWEIKRLSAPFTLPMIMFPVCGLLELVLLKLSSHFCSQPGAIVNTVYFASFFFTGITCCWCLRLLGFSRLLAALLAILYAFLPSAFFRNTSHLMMVYYLVPFVCTMALTLSTGAYFSFSRKNQIVLVGGTILLGFSYIYLAFFGCFLLLIAAIWMFKIPRCLHGLKLVLSLLLITGGISLLNLIPSALAWQKNPDGRKELNFKTFNEADTFGLKIRHLLTPRSQHPLKFFASFAEKTRGKYPLDNENMFASLGLLGSIGFLLLAANMLWGFGGYSERALTFRVLGSLTLACLFLATIGGFGSLFNYLISPEVRCYNRISVFIAFYCFLAFGFWLQRAEAQLPTAVNFVLICIIGTLGIADQASFSYLRDLHRMSQERYPPAAEFVTHLEANLEPGSMIYELPSLPYPGTPSVLNMTSQEHLLPFIVSSSLRWSFPALSDEAVLLKHKLDKCRPKDLAENLRSIGFAGIWVNRMAYESQGEKLLSELVGLNCSLPLFSSDGRYAFVGLPKLVPPGQASSRTTISVLNDVATGDIIDFSTRGDARRFLGRGWSGQEQDIRWTLGERAELDFTFSQFPSSGLRCVVRAAALVGPSHPLLTVQIKANGTRISEWKFGNDQILQKFVIIPASVFRNGKHLQLTFLPIQPSTPKELGINNNDQRRLGLAFRELTFQEVSTNSVPPVLRKVH